LPYKDFDYPCNADSEAAQLDIRRLARIMTPLVTNLGWQPLAVPVNNDRPDFLFAFGRSHPAKGSRLLERFSRSQASIRVLRLTKISEEQSLHHRAGQAA